MRKPQTRKTQTEKHTRHLPTGAAIDSVVSNMGVVDDAINEGVGKMQDIAPADYACVSAYMVSLLFTFIVLTLYKVVKLPASPQEPALAPFASRI